MSQLPGMTLNNLTQREKSIIIINNDFIVSSDVIVILEGDGYSRIYKAQELLSQNYAPSILISGGIDDPSNGNFPASALEKECLSRGIPQERILIESRSQNTKEQAENVIALAQEHKWTRIILVASHYHQYRAYLTFLKVILKKGLSIILLNAPAAALSWFEQNAWGKRCKLVEVEFDKIEYYGSQGDLATYAEAIEYQQWKEKVLL